MTTFVLAKSAFVPIAVGFFGLGVGYLIYAPQELLGFPARNRAVDLASGIWGFWMPGFMQFLTGIYLLTGLTWFNVFSGVRCLRHFAGSRWHTGDISIPAPSRTAGWPSHSCFSAFLEWTFFGVPETSP